MRRQLQNGPCAPLDRRLQGAGGPSAAAYNLVRSSGTCGLLHPQHIANVAYPDMSTVDIDGGRITYAIQGPESAPLILYLHGWGDDFRVVLSLEYPLIEAGFRLLGKK